MDLNLKLLSLIIASICLIGNCYANDTLKIKVEKTKVYRADVVSIHLTYEVSTDDEDDTDAQFHKMVKGPLAIIGSQTVIDGFSVKAKLSFTKIGTGIVINNGMFHSSQTYAKRLDLVFTSDIEDDSFKVMRRCAKFMNKIIPDANKVDSYSVLFSKKDSESIYNDLHKDAVNDAKKEAKYLAEIGERTLGRIVNVARTSESANASSTTMDITISVDLELEFELK